MPKNVRMFEKYRERGFMVIGVHDSRRGVDRMPAVARALKVTYPIGVDRAGASVRDWNVSFWPTYAVIDPNGIVRAAGLQPQHVESVVVVNGIAHGSAVLSSRFKRIVKERVDEPCSRSLGLSSKPPTRKESIFLFLAV